MSDRISALREVMRRESIDAFIFPSTDPHNGEYVPDHWKCREWISGFNGSAGTAVVTLNEAALWTDSRYFIAAAEQLEGTGFVLMKDGLEDTPSISKWLGRKLSFNGGNCVGVDGMVMSANDTDNLISELRKEGGITVRTNFDPLAEIWKDRPELPSTLLLRYGKTDQRFLLILLRYSHLNMQERVPRANLNASDRLSALVMLVVFSSLPSTT